MKIQRRILVPVLLLLVVVVSLLIYSLVPAAHPSADTPYARKIDLKGFTNFYQLSDSVFRSEQPGKDDMAALEKMGIRTILNLRNYHSDTGEAEKTTLILEHLPMNADEITSDDILRAMAILKTCKKPVLIHCLHGSDRTGCIVASYRMVFQNWSREKAVEELKNEAFGYHASWFPNIEKLLMSMDVSEIRSSLGLPTVQASDSLAVQ